MHKSYRLVDSIISSFYASVEFRKNYNIALSAIDTSILKNVSRSLFIFVITGIFMLLFKGFDEKLNFLFDL